ncbi:MAG TPA: VTT domain-containing protein [Tepidisphaeraceae bacterium]|nr:VTT domain-containing protein [Tepidisphaeraceae bacterium]
MEFFSRLYNLLRHLGDDSAWASMVSYIGQPTLYAVLFAIIFAETGLVITPFLPGDSLLFALGAIGARHEIGINLPLVTVLLIVAAILGDAVNYWIGYKLGPAVFKEEDDAPAAAAAGEPNLARPPGKRSIKSRLLNRNHLLKAQAFYEKYGGKTIILARFVPIVRTFAPFVAGVGRMNFFRFWLFNIVGAIAWVVICVAAGYFFGGFAFVKKHFELVIVAIIVISVLPMVFELWQARRAAKRGGSEILAATTLGERAGNEA